MNSTTLIYLVFPFAILGFALLVMFATGRDTYALEAASVGVSSPHLQDQPQAATDAQHQAQPQDRTETSSFSDPSEHMSLQEVARRVRAARERNAMMQATDIVSGPSRDLMQSLGGSIRFPANSTPFPHVILNKDGSTTLAFGHEPDPKKAIAAMRAAAAAENEITRRRASKPPHIAAGGGEA